MYFSPASVSRVDVILNSCIECKVLMHGISESLRAQVYQVSELLNFFRNFDYALQNNFLHILILRCSHLLFNFLNTLNIPSNLSLFT